MVCVWALYRQLLLMSPAQSTVRPAWGYLSTRSPAKNKLEALRFEFERKNKGAECSFRLAAETERCELVLTWYARQDSKLQRE